MATTSKNTDEVDGQAGTGALYVKVSMDGAPFKRKIDLKNHSGYQDLSSTLEKKFSCFTLGKLREKTRCAFLGINRLTWRLYSFFRGTYGWI